MKISMHPIIHLYSSFFCACFIGLSTCQTHAADLAGKYDFEEGGLAGWSAGHQDHWQSLSAWKDIMKPSLDQTESHSGGKSLKLELLGNDGISVISPGIPTPLGDSSRRRLTIRLFTKTQNIPEGDVGIRVLEHGDNGKALRFLDFLETKTQTLTLPVGDGWTETVVEGVLDEKTSNVVLMFGIAAPGTPAILWIDDINAEVTAQ